MNQHQTSIGGVVTVVGGIAAVTALCDQVSKWAVMATFTPGEGVTVIPGLFNFTLLFNKGAAFGLFAQIESNVIRLALLALSTIIALCVLFTVLLREYRHDRWGQVVVGLVLGGAIGNVIDRVRLGAVVDFLDFYLGSSHWPAFNVADSAICVGVFFLVIRKSSGSAKIPSVAVAPE